MSPDHQEANPLPPAGPQGIGRPKLLLGEGVEECCFFRAMLDHLGIRDVAVEQYGGKYNLGNYIAALVRRPEYPHLRSIGITRDADNDPRGAFQGVCSVLRMHGLGIPASPGVVADGSPRLSVYVMPDADQSGMLEDLCMASVSDDPAIPCVDRFLECVQSTGRSPEPAAKARVRVWLASLPKPDLGLGQAAAAGHWPWGSAAFTRLTEFLRNL